MVDQSTLPPVINTSPLIFLTKADLLNLLHLRYATVLVPEIVVAEIGYYGPLNSSYQTITNTDWLKIIRECQVNNATLSKSKAQGAQG